MAATPTVAARVGEDRAARTRVELDAVEHDDARRRARPRGRAAGPRRRRPCRGRSPAPSRPDSRSPSRAPLSASIANEREIASSDARSTVTQNSPGATRVEHAPVGVEREREQQEHDRGRTAAICCRVTRDARLDAEVLARDEQHLAPEHHGARPSTAGVVRADRARRRSRRGRLGAAGAGGPPAASTTSRSRAGGRARARATRCSTVRPSAGGARDDLVEHGAPVGVEARRAARRAAAGAGRGPARPRAPGGAVDRRRAAGASRRATPAESERARAPRRRRRASPPRPAPRSAGSRATVRSS